MKRKLYLAAIALAATAVLSGCAKDGATGPQGPQGPAGNANVLVTQFTITGWDSNSNPPFWYKSLPDGDITSNVHDGGTVQVFFSVDAGTTWIALPYTDVNTVDYFMEYLTQAGEVQVNWIYNGNGLGSDPNTYYSATTIIKVVVIPPVARMAHSNLNWNNYSEIKAAFNLKD